jgi:hypothetical protein
MSAASVVRSVALTASVVACSAPGPSNAVAPLGIPVATKSPPPIAAPTPEGTRFLRRPVAIGDRYEVKLRARSSYEQAQGDFRGDDYTCDYAAVVLPTTGTLGHRLQITFVHHERRSIAANGDVFTKPSPLHGKTFVLDAAGPTVTDETGSPVSAETFDAAARVVSDLGVRERVAVALPDGPLPLGAEAPGLGEGIFQALNAKTWTLKRSRAELTHVSAEGATFALALQGQSESGLSFDLSGTARVLPEDRTLRDLDLRGTFAGPPPDHAPGKLFVRRQVTLVPAPARPGPGTSPSP